MLLLALFPALAAAHTVYVMNSNHTDYNWNGTAAQYDAAMLSEMDYHLQQILLTQGAPVEEQARYTADNWYWLWLYEQNRTPAELDALIDAIRTGHVTIPLNPFVTLYGALPTEAVIRAGYYPGRMMRRHGIDFLLAENVENHTNPWGLASLWAGSGVRYTWKGICGCAQSAPDRQDDELFVWEGPDGKTLLFKWYRMTGANTDWGGYSEARDSLLNPANLDVAISRTVSQIPGVTVTGMFGAGWDDVSWENSDVVTTVESYNATAVPGDWAVVSNGVDFFEDLEARGETVLLNVLRGGWGNDWDMWAASLAERTSRARGALERLRLAEALAVYAQREDRTFWAPVRAGLELGMVSAWKYFEHGWDVTAGGPSLGQMMLDKEGWVQDLEASVEGAITAAEAVLAGRFQTQDGNTVLAFNALGFPRTDVVQVEVASGVPHQVLTADTEVPVPAQVVQEDGTTFVRFVAFNVPAAGYGAFDVRPGTPLALPPAATVDTLSRTIESDRYRVVLGTSGEIVELLDKAPDPDVPLAGTGGMNALGSGTIIQVLAENVGPVSATLRIDLTGPLRTVRVTLYAEVDRVDIDNRITENVSGLHSYSFHSASSGAQIRFEEIGAIARPGLVSEGGDFLQGTRASRMTLNHFVDFEGSGYHTVLSNRDAYAMQVNDSTNAAFDLIGDTVHVIAMEQALGAGISNQGGDTLFRNRFALRGIAAPFDGAEALRTSLAHQNPLHAIRLPANPSGLLPAQPEGLIAVDSGNVVVTAFKPGEDPTSGFIVRAWEMGGVDTDFEIDATALGATEAFETSLIETDVTAAKFAGGVISASIDAHELRAWRISTALRLPVSVQMDLPSAGVRLDWTGGAAPFVVKRTMDPASPGSWGEITPYGGTTDPFWVDAGVLGDGETYYYRAEEPR